MVRRVGTGPMREIDFDDIMNDPITVALEGLTAKEAAYCRLVVEGWAFRDAYVKAGYAEPKTIDKLAAQVTKMNQRQHVREAIKKLQAIANKESVVTRDMLVQKLFEHRELALEGGQVGAANAAVMGVAKIMGLEVNKSEVSHKHTYEMEQATQELFEMLSRRGRRIAPPSVESEAVDVTPTDD